jgi:hypothetical protein
MLSPFPIGIVMLSKPGSADPVGVEEDHVELV